MTQLEPAPSNPIIRKTFYGKIIHEVRPVYWVSLFILISILAVYGQLHDYQFITLDDPTYVKENSHIREGLTLNGMYWSLTSVYSSNWHPLTWLSHMIDIELYGMDAGRHHMSNIIFHIINSLLLLLTLIRFTGNLWRSSVVAALFALHPINMEVVAWVSQRKTLLCFFFWLLALLSYHSYVQLPGRGRYLSVLLFFILGIVSKQAIVVFPFALMLLDYWPLGRYQIHKHEPDSAMGGSGIFRALVKEKIPFFVIAFAGSMLTYFAQKSGGAVSTFDILPLNARIANALLSFSTYLSKAFWPHNLAILYPFPDSIPIWRVGVSTILLGFITYCAVRTARRHPYFIVGWLWYLLILLPVIGIVQIGIQAMADRYAYVSLVGIFIVLTWGLSEVSQAWDHRKLKLTALAITSLLVLMASAYKQAQTWRNSVTVFKQALSVSTDNYLAYNNMGFAFSSQNRMDDAIKYYAVALKLKPDYADARFNLGVALFTKGKYGEAADQFTRALRMNPYNTKSLNNLGAALTKLGRVDEALQHYKAAIRINPQYVEAHRNLAHTLFERGEYLEAMRQYRFVIRLDPSNKHAHNNLGIILIKLGKTDDAIYHFSHALRIDNNFEEAQYNLTKAKMLR